jgi:hypothetical protein
MPGGNRMWRHFAIVSAFLCAEPAFAGSAQLVLEGTVSPVCTIAGAAASISLGEASRGAVGDIGNVALTCNLADAGPTVSLSSLNHGLKRDGGDELLAYGMEWNLPGTTAFEAISSGTGTVTTQLDAIAPGTPRSARLVIKVSAAEVSGKAAGTYRDVIVISISP